jgi:aminomethyltransferase
MAVQSTATVVGRLGPPRLEARVGPADATAFELAAGEHLQIEDLQGCQVSDLVAFHRDRPGVGISTTVTRALVDGLFPLPGQGIYDPDGELLLTLLEDTVGRHDTFGIACNRETYAALGYPDHPNCTDNFNRELAVFGYAPRRFYEPINWFYNTRIGRDGRIVEIEPALSKAGDYVLLRAERDLVAAASACPDDVTPTNGFDPTDVMVRVFPARAGR